MSTSEIPVNKKKIPKYGIRIISIVIAIAIVMLLAQHFPIESKEQDQIIDKFLFSVGVTLLGVMLGTLRKAFLDKYIVDVFQSLIFIMIPFSALIPLLSSPQIFWYIFPMYFGVIFFWFIFTDEVIIGGQKQFDLRRNRDDEQQNAMKISLTLFFILIGLSSFIFVIYCFIILPQTNIPIN